MKVNVHSIHFDADQKLVTFINKKIDKLNVFLDGILSADVYLKVDKVNAKDNKIAEVSIKVAGKELFAKKQCDSFEEAVDNACGALKKQAEKYKAKTV